MVNISEVVQRLLFDDKDTSFTISPWQSSPSLISSKIHKHSVKVDSLSLSKDGVINKIENVETDKDGEIIENDEQFPLVQDIQRAIGWDKKPDYLILHRFCV